MKVNILISYAIDLQLNLLIFNFFFILATGNPEPRYYWKKNGLDFDYVAYDKRISQQPKRGTLVFGKPENIDEGMHDNLIL